MTIESKFRPLEELPVVGPADVLPEGFAEVRAVPGHRNPPPAIRWGDFFEPGHPKEMPDDWKLERAKKVAAAMNEATRASQEHYRELLKIALHQEAQLRQWEERWLSREDINSSLIERENEAKQARLQEMQALQSQLHAAQKRIRELEAERG